MIECLSRVHASALFLRLPALRCHSRHCMYTCTCVAIEASVRHVPLLKCTYLYNVMICSLPAVLCNSVHGQGADDLTCSTTDKHSISHNNCVVWVYVFLILSSLCGCIN